MPTRKFTITIKRHDPVADVPMIKVIECESPFSLITDLEEWVYQEIDPTCRVLYVPVGSCEGCMNGEHDDCTDGMTPGWECPCAMILHQS